MANASIKLQTYLAHAGITSRRKAEELIAQRLVTVNGQVATIGQRVIPGQDQIAYQGEPVALTTHHTYILINKPVGLVSTTSDELQRSTVLSVLPPEFQKLRLYPVGRLDQDSEGLLLLTDDGDVAFHLTHPKFAVPKVYLIRLDRKISDKAMNHLKRGVLLHEGFAVALKVTQVTPEFSSLRADDDTGFWLEITINEGRHHQVRRMMERVGYPVSRLIRVQMGNLSLLQLAGEAVHVMTPDEVNSLKTYLQLTT